MKIPAHLLKQDLQESSDEENTQQIQMKNSNNNQAAKRYMQPQLPIKNKIIKKNPKQTVHKNQYRAPQLIEIGKEQLNAPKSKTPQKDEIRCLICLSNRQEICKRDKVKTIEFLGCLDCQYLCCPKCYQKMTKTPGYNFKCPGCRRDNRYVKTSELIESGRNNLYLQRLLQKEEPHNTESQEDGYKNHFPIKNMEGFKQLANKLLYCKGCFKFYKEFNRGFGLKWEEFLNPIQIRQKIIQENANILTQLDLVITTSTVLQNYIKDSCFQKLSSNLPEMSIVNPQLQLNSRQIKQANKANIQKSRSNQLGVKPQYTNVGEHSGSDSFCDCICIDK